MPLTDQELQALLPRRVDKQRAAELMALVDSAASHNTKVAKLIENIDHFAGVAVKLLKALA